MKLGNKKDKTKYYLDFYIQQFRNGVLFDRRECRPLLSYHCHQHAVTWNSQCRRLAFTLFSQPDLSPLIESDWPRIRCINSQELFLLRFVGRQLFRRRFLSAKNDRGFVCWCMMVGWGKKKKPAAHSKTAKESFKAQWAGKSLKEREEEQTENGDTLIPLSLFYIFAVWETLWKVGQVYNSFFFLSLS